MGFLLLSGIFVVLMLSLASGFALGCNAIRQSADGVDIWRTAFLFSLLWFMGQL